MYVQWPVFANRRKSPSSLSKRLVCDLLRVDLGSIASGLQWVASALLGRERLQVFPVVLMSLRIISERSLHPQQKSEMPRLMQRADVRMADRSMCTSTPEACPR